MVSVGAAAHGALLELADDPLPSGEIGAAALDAVGSVIPHEGYALIGLDPSTGLRSLMFSRDGVGTSRALAHNEHQQHDVNLYADLARQPVPSGVLKTTDERGARSPRMRFILRPAGYTSELRLVLRAHRRAWGALSLFRSENLPAFTDTEAVSAAALGGPLSQVMRKFSVRRCTSPGAPLPHGAAILERDDTISAAGDSFTAWLHELAAGGHDDMTSEDLLRIVFDAASGARAGGSPASVCLRAMTGRWVCLQAQPLDRDSGRVIATLAPATPDAVIPSYALWSGLTPRETQLLGLLVGGHPTKRLARALGISRYTAEDHLRSIYRKTRTDGRDDLLSALLTGC